ncbi:protein phosphatase 2C domain-containing protein [Oscillospiraceae bacterium OttesenSCG-928-F05]|nr:protein phosphatase 2C domain-containing protein [Oscillospiraceae bacterium OttesenSCG-928-F05]
MLFFKQQKEPDAPPQEDPVTIDAGTGDTLPAAYYITTACATHIGTREYQQDAAYVTEGGLYTDESAECAVGIICDGMGGMEHGERASGEAITVFAEALSKIGPETDIPAYLEIEVQAVNAAVRRIGEPGGHGTGTTLIAAVIRRNHLHWVSVGDSRIYILRGDEIVQVTTDHNYGMRLKAQVEEGKITPEAAAEHPQREALISYIGMEFVEEIGLNYNPFPLLHDDIILLCSDGLTKSLSDDDIYTAITEQRDNIQEAARLLPLKAFDASLGSQDNTSVILMKYEIIG